MSLFAYALGLAPGIAILSPAEWLVHKYMLHTPKRKRTFINRASSYAHHDVHHAAFMGPEHYYRDITNEHETIHFGVKDVGLIGGIAFGLGYLGQRACEQAYAFLAGNPGFDGSDLSAAWGMLTAAAIGYIGYEATHHTFHVIGPRRLAINRTLGDLLQVERDGKLRFTKPLLDDICNVVEQYVDVNAKRLKRPVQYAPSLEDRFNEQVERNREMGNEILPHTFPELLNRVSHQMLERERELRAGMTMPGRFLYRIGRGIQRVYRGSDTWFGRIMRNNDNHHFLHHGNYTKNLNVFLTWADSLFGTKLDSRSETLDTWQKKHLLCPNSPDVEPFVRPATS